MALAMSPVNAQDAVALAGAEAGKGNGYAYLGTVLPLPGNRLGNGWVQRYWLDYTSYRYEKGPGAEIDATVVGGEAALGFQESGASGWWAAYLGARYGNTRLSPDDPTNEDEGGRLRAKLQLEGETAVSPSWRLNGIVSHLVGHSSYWLRVRAETTLGNGLRVGPEFVAQGDPNYRLHTLGVFVGGIKAGRNAALTLKGGLSKLESDSAGAYVGVEAYLPY
ncbi:MAG: cellulose biosynthesis protein BcsS [Thiobacillus sp.]